MAKFWKKRVDENNESVRDAEGKPMLDEVDPKQIDLTGPQLVYVCGFLTTHNKPKYIMGSIKYLEEMMGNKRELSDEVQITGISHKSKIPSLWGLLAYNLKPNSFYSESAMDFARDLFMPRVAENVVENNDGTLSGDKIDAKKAGENLRNITLFAYSYGTVFIQEVQNALTKCMEEIGYSKEEKADILEEVVLIAIGNATQTEIETDGFTTVYFSGTTDLVTTGKNIIAPNESEKNIGRSGESLTITHLSERTVLVSAYHPPEMLEENKKGDLEPIDKLLGTKVTIGGKTFRPYIRTRHEIEYYVTMDPEQNGNAAIAHHAAFNAIRRDGPVDVIELLKPAVPNMHPDYPVTLERYAEYLNRVVDGMDRGDEINGTIEERIADRSR